MKRKLRSIAGLVALCLTASLTWADPISVGIPTTQPTSPTTRPTTGPIEPALAALIQQLGSEDFKQRQSATEELRNMGADAKPALKDAIASDNPEIRTRSQRLLKQLEEKDNPPQQANAGQNPNANPRLRMNGGVFVIPPGGANARMRAGGGMLRIAAGGKSVSDATVMTNGNTYKLHTDADGLKLSITEDGKTKEYAAKTADELKEKEPEAYKVYEKVFGPNGMGQLIH
jgi:hypothetical protein